MRYVCLAAVAVLSVLAPSAAFGQLSITNYVLVSEQDITPTRANLSYRADLVNSGTALGSASAMVTTLDPYSIRVVPGQDTLQFPSVPANSQVTSSNTFTIQVNPTVPVDFSKVQWSFQTTAAGPIANPGPNQTVKVGSTVILDGSGSTNPSGAGTLTYKWAFAFRPAGTSSILMNATTPIATFVTDVVDTYVVTLTVSNGVASSSANVMVTTVAGGTPPVANAGQNQTVPVGSTVTLNGSGSTSSSGKPLTYAWTLTARPSGSTATLAGANTVMPMFVADKPGTYMAQLVVNDGLSSAPSNVTISTSCVKPVANAGPNQSINTLGALVQLNGAGSTDACSLPLTYQWSLITLPANSTATLSNSAIVNPTFTADRPGIYVAQLIVNNGTLSSDPATVTITDQQPLTPTANAGPNQMVTVGSTVQLAGSGTDPQNLPLTFQWTLINKPANSSAVLSNTTIPNPTFIADLPGPYIAQLVVSNGMQSSAPATVTINTKCSQPTANPGLPQNVQVGATVTLNGNGSGDACNDPLTYAWSFTTLPAGSAATLSGATTVSPTFVADVAGMYVVQLIVNNGIAPSNPATVTVTAAQATADIILPANVRIQPGDTAGFPVTLANPSPSGGIFMSLSSSDPTKLTISPATVFIPQGALGSIPKITGIAAGSATITASASGLKTASQLVLVGSGPTIVFQPASLTITSAGPQNLTLTLSPPAPGNLTVNLSSSNTGVATVPASVMFSTGATSVQVPVTGVANGSATITASAQGIPSATASVTVQLPLTSIGVPASTTVGLGLSATFAVTLSQAAPAGGVTVNLASSDTNKVTAPPSVFVAQGATTPATQPQVTGAAIGSATITASATGYTSGTGTVTVSAPAMSFTGSPLGITVGATGNLTLTLSGGQAPAGGLTVNLSSNNTGIATVSATVSFAPGATSVPVTVTGVAVGSATITASATGIASATATVNVVTLGIGIPANTTLGLGQSATLAVTLSQAAPAGGVTVLLASMDTSKVTVPASVFVAAGATTPAPQPQVTGVGIGSATITASATGYTSGNGTVTVTAPGMNFSGSPLTISLPPPGNTGTLTLNLTGGQAPASGLTVNLSSSDTTKATVPLSVGFAPGASSATVTVTGVAVGSATITASATGIASATASVIVQGPAAINVPASTTLGLGLSTVFAVSLSQPAPAGGVTVMLASSDTSKVTVPASVFIAAGATTPGTQPQVTGAGIGSATVTATATGYTSASGTVNVQPPSMNFAGPLTITLPGTGILTLNLTGGQAPASGLTVNLSSSDTTKATVPVSVTFAPGASSAPVTVTGVAVGSATITASATGIVSATASVTVQNTSGPLTLSFSGDVSISAGTQGTVEVRLSGGKAPPGGYLVSLITSDSTVATAQDATIPAGGNIAIVTVTGVGVGLARITARIPSVPSLAPATANVTVTMAPSPLVLPIVVPTASVGQNLQTSITLSLLMYTSCTAQSQTCQPVLINGQLLLVVVDRFTGQPVLSAGTFPQDFLPITVTSSDPTKLLIATSGICPGIPKVCEAPQITFKLKQNLSTVGVFLQSFASSGTVTLTASAPGFPSGQATITLTPSGFLLAGPGGTPSFMTNAGSALTPLTVTPARLDASLRLAEAQALRAGYNDPLNGPFDDGQGSITCRQLFTDPTDIQTCEASGKYAFANLSGQFTTSVTVSSSNPSVGSVLAPVVFNGGDSLATAQFKPDATNTGSTTLTALTPNLFSTPSAGTSVTAIVTPAGITCGTVTVGRSLEAIASCTLQGGTPSAGLQVNINSSDSSRLLLSAIPNGSTTCTDPGSPSITVFTKSASLGGVTNYVIPAFCVYGLASSGSATYSISVPGYATSSGSVTLAPSGFVIAGPGGIGAPSFSPQTPTTTITVFSALLDAGLNFVSAQPLAIGQSVNATVTSSNTAVGTVSPTTVTITGGSSSNTTTFTTGSAGNTTLSVSTPAGFSTPSPIPNQAPAPTGVIVTIVPKSFALSCNSAGSNVVGRNLEASCIVTIGQPASAGGQPVTLTSNNSSLLVLSATASGAGSTSIPVTIPAGSTSTTYYAQGLQSSGTVTHTATAPGFTTATATMMLAPSGVVMQGPFGYAPFTASLSAGPAPITVSMAVLNTNAASCPLQAGPPCFFGPQQLRGGIPSVQVSLSSTDTTVGTIVSPVTITAGSDHTTVQFTPLKAGSTTLLLTTPSGFTVSSNDTSLSATVTTP